MDRKTDYFNDMNCIWKLFMSLCI